MRPSDFIYTGTAREAAILTTSYVYHTIDGPNQDDTDLTGYNQVVLYIDFTLGDLTTMELVFEYSIDGTNWFPETTESISSGVASCETLVHQFDADTVCALPNTNGSKYMRVGVKGTGTVTDSELEITYSLSYT
jgi:hypothetical protein